MSKEGNRAKVSVAIQTDASFRDWALASRAGRTVESFRVEAGAIPPDWFWEAMADGRLKVTNATAGDLDWGRMGIDVLGQDGWFHVDLDGELRHDQVKPPSS